MLYLVRHGRTEANAHLRLQGRIDLPLNDVGRRQAAALGLAITEIDRLICSPMLRTRQTAEVFGMEPELDDRWMEMDYGVMDGVRMAEVSPEMWDLWTSDADYAPEGGETLHELAARVWAACDDLIDDAQTRNIVVVTHATPIKAGMAWALGAEASLTWRAFVDQASITRIMVRDRGPVLAAFNVVPPLADDQPAGR